MSTAASAPVAASSPDEGARDPIAAFYQRADALCRTAIETCRQHERMARLVQMSVCAPEQRASRAMVTACDEALEELAAAYERATQRAHPDKDDACWHAANGLWLASREYARRQRTSARAGRHIAEQHDPARLAELALDYDLEASALLLLKQATEAYRKVRPKFVAC
jgi:hypothetical protein